jgi:hypothetical protein
MTTGLRWRNLAMRFDKKPTQTKLNARSADDATNG